jgi:hypothetical protein
MSSPSLESSAIHSLYRYTDQLLMFPITMVSTIILESHYIASFDDASCIGIKGITEKDL